MTLRERSHTHLAVNPIACDGHGSCAELLPEHIHLDPWGYPVLDPGPVPRHHLRDAKRAVALCPRLALRLERRHAPAPERVA
ncbi:MAG: ferredoxin [Thermoleophilia bacterium]